MSAKTSTSPGTDARSDSVRRGGYAAGDNSGSSNKDRKAQTDSGGSSRQTAVYGPELPPSMLRSKVDSAAAAITDISNPPNFIDIAKFLREESRNEHSKSDYMRRTENELQTLFYSHLKSIMDSHGYKGKYFKEQDVARVMVDTGLMSSLSDDPALALASDLKARMVSIVHKNMRQMASSVMVPEFFEDMAVDPMVIDTLVDMSRQSPSGSKQAASVVAFAAAAAVAEADADFENALKALDTMTLVESFHLDELCRNQQNPALAASHFASADPELRPPSKPASTSSSSTTAPASKLTSESASASASKSASKSPSTESGQAAAAQTKATHTAPSIPLLNASLKELAAKTEEMQIKSSQLFDNMDYSTAVAAQAVNAASARNAGLSSSMLPSRAQIKRSRKRLKGKERETTVATNGDVKSRRAPLPETQQPQPSANKKVSQPASGSSKQRSLGHQPVLPPSDSLCQSFLSSSASRPGPVHESLDQSKKLSDQAEKLWSSDSADEHKQVRTFWLSLSDIERQALILVEKEVVLARVRDHQNFSCSCNICSRKREAIEQELDFLYDCYYEELQERVCRGRVRMAIRKMEPIAKANIMSSVEAVVDTAMSNLVASSNGLSKMDLQTAIIKSIKQAKLTSSQANPDNRGPTDIGTFLMRAMTASVLENLSSKDSAAKEKNEHNRDAAIEGAVQAIRSWVSGTLELNKDSSDDMVPSDAESEEILNNNDLFYTENMLDTIGTFPTDSKKFFDMMERLAEYRMRREEVTIEDINDHERAFFANAAPSDKPPLKDRESMTHSWVRRARDSSHRQRHCPDCHGEISESEEQAGDLSNLPNTNLALSAAAKSLLNTDLCYATDSEYEDIDEDGDAIGVFARTSDGVEDAGIYSSDSQDHDCEETDDEDDEDDDEDEDLCDTDEDLDDLDDLDSEYAEREAEEGRKVFQLFAARLFEQRVINTYREKIARERQQNLIKELEDEEKEQQAKEKRKQKKREREKERKKQLQLRKEQERQAKEAALKIEQERKREAEQKRYDEMMQKRREQELKTKKALEERNKRILEEADRRMEREKLQKQRAEEERLQKEQERIKKAREEELLQQQQQQQQKQKQQRQKQRQKLKEKASTTNSSLQTHPSSPVSPKTTTAAATMPKVSADACSSKRALFSTPDEALKTPPATARPAPTPVTAQATVAAGSPSSTGLAYGSAPISASVQLSSVAQQPLILPIPKPAGMPNGVLAEPSLLASSIGASMLQPPSPSTGSLKMSRPSLPLINPFDLGSVSPTTPSFGMPGRMRANSGSGIYHSFLPTSAPVQTAANHAVSPEIDAEISSIVGRVMGSCTLQDDLISGAEWRTEPLDAFTPDHSSLSMSAASLGMGMGIGMGVDASFGDLSARRNSMPHSRAASNMSALGNVEAHIGSGSRAAGARFNAPPEVSREIDSIHSAYCALERFRRDTRTVSAATLGNEAAFGGFHSVSELAKMHGRMSEPDIWAICSTSAQTNPGFCRVNHATHAVAFARTGISGGGLGMSPSTPMAMEGLNSVTDSLGSGNVGNGNSTPLNHLAAIAEDMMSAFSLQPQAGNDSSPLLANSFPLNMSPSYAQSRSPLVLSSQSQSQTQLRPHQLGPASRVPIMTAPMAMPGSGLKQQQQISPSIPMSHAGLGFSPLIHQGPSAQMFFNPMSIHTPPATSSLMPPPFQQQMPTGSWSPSKPHLAGAVSNVAGSDMMQQTAPLGSVPAQLRQIHMFQPSAQQHFPH